MTTNFINCKYVFINTKKIKSENSALNKIALCFQQAYVLGQRGHHTIDNENSRGKNKKIKMPLMNLSYKQAIK